MLKLFDEKLYRRCGPKRGNLLKYLGTPRRVPLSLNTSSALVLRHLSATNIAVLQRYTCGGPDRAAAAQDRPRLARARIQRHVTLRRQRAAGRAPCAARPSQRGGARAARADRRASERTQRALCRRYRAACYVSSVRPNPRGRSPPIHLSSIPSLVSIISMRASRWPKA